VKLRQKIGIGVLLIRRSSGVKGKLGALRQIAGGQRSWLTGGPRRARGRGQCLADYHL
jgi:hypothetical protein